MTSTSAKPILDVLGDRVLELGPFASTKRAGREP